LPLRIGGLGCHDPVDGICRPAAKHADRTAAIMAGLTAPAGYAHVYYLTAPAARGVVARCAAALPGDAPARLTVWDLPPAARTPGT
jgi:hypothetical protein